jgi:hypothetical protein
VKLCVELYTVDVPPPNLDGVLELEDDLEFPGGEAVTLGLLGNVGRGELEGASSVKDGSDVREGFPGEFEVLGLMATEIELLYIPETVAIADTLGEKEEREDPDTFTEPMGVNEDTAENVPEKVAPVVKEAHGLENPEFVGTRESDVEGDGKEDPLVLGEGE